MTKNEKELVNIIEGYMTKKKIEGDATTCYKIEKRSNKDYLAEAKIGNSIFTSKGKDVKDVVKNLIKEIK